MCPKAMIEIERSFLSRLRVYYRRLIIALFILVAAVTIWMQTVAFNALSRSLNGRTLVATFTLIGYL